MFNVKPIYSFPRLFCANRGVLKETFSVEEISYMTTFRGF